MARACTVCEHVERDSIDAALVCGEPMPAIAKRHGVSRSAVQRHAKRHLSPALAAMQVEAERDAAKGLLQRTERLIERTERLLLAAEQDGKVSAALSAVAQLRPLLELLGKVTGEIKDTAPTVTVNLLSSPEILAALNVVYSELADHPDVRQRIAARLQPERLQIEAPR